MSVLDDISIIFYSPIYLELQQTSELNENVLNLTVVFASSDVVIGQVMLGWLQMIAQVFSQ